MSKSSMTILYYYIAEDSDDPEMPNAFGIHKALEEIRYQDIENNFPLPGKYYFRFKFKLNGNKVWLDLTNKESRLPVFENRIFVKATRLREPEPIKKPKLIITNSNGNTDPSPQMKSSPTVVNQDHDLLGDSNWNISPTQNLSAPQSFGTKKQPVSNLIDDQLI